MVCAPVTDARVPRCVCRQVVIGAVDAPPISKKGQWLLSFGAGAAAAAPPVRPEPMTAKNSNVLAAGVAPRGRHVVAHVLK